MMQPARKLNFSGPSGLQAEGAAVLPLTVTCARFEPQSDHCRRRAAGSRLIAYSQLTNWFKKFTKVTMWQCDNVTTTTNEPNNFSLSLQELQCNCSATHWPCIRIVSVLQHNCKYSFSVYPFITTPPAGACSEGEKKKACRRAVRSVCDCIMFSFSVVCDRYTNTSVTVTVTESLL